MIDLSWLDKATGTSEDPYKLYDKEDLSKLWRLLLYKEMGFQLEDIAVLIERPEEETRWILEERLISIHAEIEKLSRMYHFTEKILEYGVPDDNFVKHMSQTTDYKTMAKRLAERV